MAQTKATTQIIVGRSRLTVKDIGVPNTVVAQPEGENKPHTLGIILGRAVNVKEKKVVNRMTGEENVVDAILGAFEGRRASPFDNKDGTETIAIQSSVLYLPSGISEMITVPLKEALKSDDSKPSIDFAFQISTIKASNPAGYSYQIKQLHKPAESDPLAALRDLALRPALPAPEEKEAA